MITRREFYEGGYLQEANRQFFNPLGLALALDVGDTAEDYEKEIKLGDICFLDSREDPEGFVFKDELTAPEAVERFQNIQKEFKKRAVNRLLKYGFDVQPLGSSINAEDL